MKADICGSETLAKKSAARGHPGLNRGPLDLQSNALPLSYTPVAQFLQRLFIPTKLYLLYTVTHSHDHTESYIVTQNRT